MHPYRTHHCAELRASDVGGKVRLSGWVHRKRDHGNLLFVDLRDHHGITQIVADVDSEAFALIERSEEHTSELQSLMRISYAVFCLKKKQKIKQKKHTL